MIPIGEVYKPAGSIELRSILVTLILGSTTAALAAVLIWLWEISPVPTLVIITPIAQGLIIGVAFAFMIGRQHMRLPRLAAAIAFVCGLLSIGLVHYGHHRFVMNELTAGMREEINADPELAADKKAALLAEFDRNPTQFVNLFLNDRTGHGGFAGTMLLRNQQGVRIKHTNVTGWGLWILWAVEALFVAGGAAALARNRAAEPYCEDCGSWCPETQKLFRRPVAAANPLVTALREDRLGDLQALGAQPAPPAAEPSAGVTLRCCPHCDQTFADVVTRALNKKKREETKTLVSYLRISPEATALLRGSDAAPVAEPTADGDVEAVAEPLVEQEPPGALA